MKQLPKLLIFSLLLTIVGCGKEYDDSALVGRVNNLESRVLKLEQLCQQMNTNISSLQTIVSALQNNDYVTGVVPVTEGGKTVGYTISFTKSQPVTIYHGKDGVDGKNGTDGKDGQNGADGKDGKSYVPVIGVRQDTDGVYYWTLDGKWLIDGSGNKVKAEGRDGKNGADGKDGLNGSDGRDGADGKNGQDGADGKDGANGTDGRDGITPVLKIEDNYWLISYDNGGNWTKLGKATGENGRDGVDGKDGKNGENGRDGVDGKDGKDGENGHDGVDGKDGINPLLQIIDGYWYASYDNGSTWQELGKATGADGKDGHDGINGADGRDGDSFFQDVTQDDSKVHFILADGTVITLPKAVELDIVFAESDLVVMLPNSTRTISFTVTSTIKPVVVEVVSSADIKAKVILDDADGLAGKIQLTTGSVIDEYSKVVVFVSNGEKVIMRSIRFEEAGLKVEENSVKTISAEGGEVTLEFLTNVECEVVIPDEAKSWISVVPDTRAMEKQTITLKIDTNNGAARAAELQIKSCKDGLLIEYVVTQDASPYYYSAAEREALISLYHSLDGDNWNNNSNWCSDMPLNEWFGVTCEDGHVTKLWLANNNLKGVIGKDIAELSKLQELSVDDNTECTLTSDLERLTELRLLHIADINIKSLPFSLLSFPHLESLNLQFSDGLDVFPDEIFEITTLRKLSYLHQPISPRLGNLTNLEDLHVGWVTETTIPEEVFNCRKLKRLSFDGLGWPSYSLMGTIPEAIGNLTELESLHITNAKFSGGLPASMSKLTKLKTLFLRRCNIGGEFPSQLLYGLSSLTEISLEDNGFIGSVSPEFAATPLWRNGWRWVCKGNKLDLNSSILYGPIPGETVYDNKGKIVDFEDTYKSNSFTIILNWAAWYNGTIPLVKQLMNVYEKYHQKGVDIIGIYDSNDDNKNLLNSMNIPWRNIEMYGFNENTYCLESPYTGVFDVVDNTGHVVFNHVQDNPNNLYNWLALQLGVDLGYYLSSDYTQDGKVTTLQSATEGKGINIVLMGDAYSDRQIADGTYGADMKYIYDNLFTEEPYKSFKECFNVYSVNVVSATEGYEHEGATLGGYFGDGTLVGGNDSKCFEYAAKAVGEQNMDETLVVVAMNSNNYAGTCYMYNPSSTTGTYGSGASVAYFPKGGDKETFARLLHHEACGHGFAKLADEYAYESMGAVPSDYASQIQTQQSSWGWWKNVDFTGDVSSVRWNAFTNDSRYANEGLGAFEGGLTYWTGVWRPTENSIMRDNTGGFNAPSREAIYCRIHKLAYGDSWNYSYEDFVTYDEINRKASSSSAPRRSSSRQTRWEPLHPPVVVGKSWKEAAKTQ